jgi:tetratricopeptide (TPR) repeat protein
VSKVHVLTGQFPEAIADYTEALKLDAKLATAYYERGTAYEWTADYDRAVADFSEAIRLDANYAAAYHERGVVFTKKGEGAKAKADLATADKLGYRPGRGTGNGSSKEKGTGPIRQEK